MLKNATRKHELDMFGWRTCFNIKWFQMDNNKNTEMESLCLLYVEYWKAQQNSEQDEDSSGNRIFNDYSCSKSICVYESFMFS